jgi:actin-related protein
VIGRPILRSEERVGDAVIEDIIGDEAAALRNYLQVTPPMEHGIVRNWEDMKYLWDYTSRRSCGAQGPPHRATDEPESEQAAHVSSYV